MKLHSMELPFPKNQKIQRTPKIVLLTTFTLVFLSIISLNCPLPKNFSFSPKSSPSSFNNISPSNDNSHDDHRPDNDDQKSINDQIKDFLSAHKSCDIFSGEWVPNPEAPYYTNTTCWAIHEHQNCMKYGRPDSEFMKWKWKPDGCDLPVFNPGQFLEIMRGKSLAFVGDSVGRNQMQSLICLISRIVYPEDVSYTSDERFKRWLYKSHNFTLATFFTPHLVRSKQADANGPTNTGIFNLYLDEYDEEWTTQIDDFDYVILSAGHWFFRSLVFFENSQLVGCRYCLLENVTDMPMYYGYRKAFRTAFKAINSLQNYKGITYLRTFAPSHFENGLWNEGGNCLRTRPFQSNETRLEDTNLELYMIQLEELKIAEREGKEKYGHWPHENVTLYNDCVHWCLPGPIDTWNDFLLEMLKMEGIKSYEEKLYPAEDRKMKFR
ncbi:hypothetical protein Patl1_21529 [Pistacia atlantica]|uniref:Uncharacterized protein n=1 Tax=Pistacia atlantica TaxID=434234 RepID=A0ACC1BM05_9ROSI|nr:hypothetical protein Patl1_21529 [Pistacia atlantica]